MLRLNFNTIKEKNMKYIIVLVLLFGGANLFARNGDLEDTSFYVVKPLIGQGRAIFLEVGSDICKPCQKMGRILYKVKQKHPRYPIYFINVRKERKVAKQLKVSLLPTQIIFDANGNELYRHVGLLSRNKVNMLLKKYKF